MSVQRRPGRIRSVTWWAAACFAAYDEQHPLSSGWEERVPLHQIAPLVVHAIKFAGGYVAAAAAAIARY